MTVDHCGTGNSASPRFSPTTCDWIARVAVHDVTWSCMDCGAVLSVETVVRPLVASRPGFAGDSSNPDRGADPHLSGGRR